MPTAPKPSEQPATLVAALAQLQTRLPDVRKTATADAGSYTYDYADLAAITKQLMPLLGELGLAFVSTPMLREGDDKFVLRYKLLHTSGESLGADYPLTGNSPQTMGSAITYARRYCLCAVTGIAPDKDDDDARAAQSETVYGRAPVRDWLTELATVTTPEQARELYRMANAERASRVVLEAIAAKGQQLAVAEAEEKAKQAQQPAAEGAPQGQQAEPAPKTEDKIDNAQKGAQRRKDT